MNDDILTLLACPACLQPLAEWREGELLSCTGCARRFTLRAGVPDLIWGKSPANEGPGDSAEMVRQRIELDRRVVVSSTATARYLEAILSFLKPGQAVVDVGAGPGTIPRLVASRAPEDVTIVAFDKSLPALDAARLALASLPRIGLLRASGRRVFPLRSAAFGVVVRRLAPALPEEILRVLSPGGAMINFTYGRDHWREVYDALASLPRPRQKAPAPAEAAEILRRQGYARAEVQPYHEVEEVAIADIALTLQGNPAAYFFAAERDLSLLRELSTRQGRQDSLRLTTHYEIRVAVAPD